MTLLRTMICLPAIRCEIGHAQVTIPEDSISPIRILSMNPRVYKSHDTLFVYSGVCKTLKTTTFIVNNGLNSIAGTRTDEAPFIVIHGNIQYDFLYRSFADTPFYQNDFRQHTI